MFLHPAARLVLMVVRLERWLSRESVEEQRERAVVVAAAAAAAAAASAAAEVQTEPVAGPSSLESELRLVLIRSSGRSAPPSNFRRMMSAMLSS